MSTYQIGRAHTVSFALNGGHIRCEWRPCVPTGRVLRKLFPAYQQARNDFVRSLGMNALVVEP
jgi:hypothetical protein